MKNILTTNKSNLIILCVFFLIVLSGCGTSTKIESVKDQSYNNAIKRIVVINDFLNRSYGMFTATFTDKFIANTSKCNIKTTFEMPMLPGTQKSDVIKNVKERNGNVDAILTITGKSMETLSYNSGPPSTTATTMIFTLLDPNSEKNIWRAEMNATFEFTSTDEAGNTMAKDIYKKLISDGILPPCAAAE